MKSAPSEKSSWSWSDRILRWLGHHRKTATSADTPPRCPACIEQEAAAHTALGIFISNLNDVAMNAAFRKSVGLCFQHLHQAIAKSPNVEITQALITISSEKLEILRVQVTEFIRETEHKTPKQIRAVNKSFWPQVIGVISGYSRTPEK